MKLAQTLGHALAEGELALSTVRRGRRLRDAIDGRPPEPHSHPGAQQLQHEFSRAAGSVGHIVWQDHALGPFGRHHPHGRRRHIVRQAAAIHREPVPLGEVGEHGRATAARVHSPRRRIRFQPPLLHPPPQSLLFPLYLLSSLFLVFSLSLEKLPAPGAADAILAIENRSPLPPSSARTAPRRYRRRRILALRLLATRAIANGAQNWRPDDLKRDLTAAARRQDALVRHFGSPSIYARTRARDLSCATGRQSYGGAALRGRPGRGGTARHSASAASRIAVHTAATSACSVASAPIDTRAIQRPSSTAGVR